ncbi:uncharacterized protein LOC119587263 [Penaeus monodon]|uniref:uncharacterized protein LOC119587263 n=1 Tax=Penaeus monodon TaxID=6687 RepID=UPI0018A76263|nr:uncharacterized protein LOC119587263 [Penaeus monodon]
MKLLVLFAAIVATTSAALQGYNLPSFKGPGLAGHGHAANAGHSFAVSGQTSTGHSSGQSTSIHSAGRPDSAAFGSSILTASGNSGTVVSGTAEFAVSGISTVSGAPSGSGISSGSEVSISTGLNGQGSFEAPCKGGEVRHINGLCIVPEITRKVFVVSVPKQAPRPSDSLPDIPPPRVDHNILFVRLPEGGVGPDPIVVPPPRQDNIVYVLSKNSQNGQRVIEVPAPPPSEPEIYFVNYDDGENPTLPGGVDLQTALASAFEANGQVITEGFGVSLAGPGGFSGAVDIGNVAGVTTGTGEGTFTNSNTGDFASGSTSQSSQIGGTITGNTYSSSSTISTSPVSGLIQNGGLFQGSQGGINPSNIHSSTSAAGSFTTAGNTGSFQSGGISTGSQFTLTTTGSDNQPSGLYSTP